MALTTQVSAKGQRVSIQVHGHFDMSLHGELSRVVSETLSNSSRYVIDLSDMDRLYDSGLGMLMHLRCLVGEDRIDIVGCSGEIENTLMEYGIRAKGMN